jgi:hypothetical protein
MKTKARRLVGRFRGPARETERQETPGRLEAARKSASVEGRAVARDEDRFAVRGTRYFVEDVAFEIIVEDA